MMKWFLILKMQELHEFARRWHAEFKFMAIVLVGGVLGFIMKSSIIASIIGMMASMFFAMLICLIIIPVVGIFKDNWRKSKAVLKHVGTPTICPECGFYGLPSVKTKKGKYFTTSCSKCGHTIETERWI